MTTLNTTHAYDLAGHRFSIEPVCSERFSVPERWQPFRSTHNPDFHLRVTPYEDALPPAGKLKFETVRWRLYTSDEENLFVIDVLKDKQSHMVLRMRPGTSNVQIQMQGSLTGVDYPLSYPTDELIFINRLPQHESVVVHACGVLYRGQVLLFVGESGAGKTTTARLWQNDPEARVLCDDRIILKKTPDGFWAYGTPWHGDLPAVSNLGAPLSHIYFIHHHPKNILSPISQVRATAMLLTQSFSPLWDKALMENTARILHNVIASVPVSSFGFSPDQSAVKFIQCQV